MEVDYGAAPAVGYRIFGFDSRRSVLTSLTRVGGFKPWMPGITQHSVCVHAPNHGEQPPHLNCTCGIWAVKSRSKIGYAYPTLALRNLDAHQRAAVKRERNQDLIATMKSVSEAFNLLHTSLQGANITPVSGSGTQADPVQIVYTHKVRGPQFKHPRGNPHNQPELMLSARVHLWGVVQEHTYGFRAEHARLIPETIRWWPRRGAWFKAKLLSHIIDKYTLAEWFDEGDDDNTISTIRDH